MADVRVISDEGHDENGTPTFNYDMFRQLGGNGNAFQGLTENDEIEGPGDSGDARENFRFAAAIRVDEGRALGDARAARDECRLGRLHRRRVFIARPDRDNAHMMRVGRFREEPCQSSARAFGEADGERETNGGSRNSSRDERECLRGSCLVLFVVRGPAAGLTSSSTSRRRTRHRPQENS